jgi:hypothetical protein
MQLKTFDDLGNLRSDVIGWWYAGFALDDYLNIYNFDTASIYLANETTLLTLRNTGCILIQIEPR